MQRWIKQAEANKATTGKEYIVIQNGGSYQIYTTQTKVSPTARIVYRTDTQTILPTLAI